MIPPFFANILLGLDLVFTYIPLILALVAWHSSQHPSHLFCYRRLSTTRLVDEHLLRSTFYRQDIRKLVRGYLVYLTRDG